MVTYFVVVENIYTATKMKTQSLEGLFASSRENSDFGIVLSQYIPGDMKSRQREQIFQIFMSSTTVTSAVLAQLTPKLYEKSLRIK